MLLPALLAVGLLAAPVRAGGSLRVCDDVVEPISLDPLREFSEKYYTIVQQVFDSLVRFDPQGRLEPALAESWRWVDEKTVEFKLRPGVAFHDGEPFDAEAVRFSLTAFLDPKNAFPGAGLLASIEGVEAVDPLTVRVRTKVPDGILIHRLAGLAPMLPPRYIAEKGREHFGRHPVGTGAFRFKEWVPGSRIELAANRGYWLKGAPKLDGLTFLFLPTERQVSGLLDGSVDVVTELPGTKTLAVMESGVAHVVKKESFYTVGSSLNTSTGPLAKLAVRRALNHAIDKDALVRYDLLGNGSPIATLSMKGEPGHDPGLKPYPYDPEQARALIKEAGYADGFRLKALVKAQGVRTMQIIAKQLSAVGVTVDVTTTTDTEAVRDMAKRDWDWVFAGCPDPLAHSFFIQFIYLSSLSPFSVTRDPVYDAKLDGMVRTIDPAEQDALGRKLDGYVYDNALSLFTYQRVKTYGVRKGVSFMPSVTGMPYFHLSSYE
ncbi:MAG: ABC transporter substrate-binding protein [Elusimicrobia bacterium]|nr:ABC transporter substrate-binding protein [Elusimicrobiota bacterium]